MLTRSVTFVTKVNQQWLEDDRAISNKQWETGRIVAMMLLLITPNIPRLGTVLELPRAMMDTDLRLAAGTVLAVSPAWGSAITLVIVALAVCTALFKARAPGIILGVVLIVSNSALYSLSGKIVHYQWVPYSIIIFAFVRWGSDRDRWSISPRLVLAWIVALGFATSAVTKVAGRWLDPTFSAVEIRLSRYAAEESGQSTLNSLFMAAAKYLPMEAMDVATVLLEAGFVLAIIRPHLFRWLLAAALTFHLAVWLGLGISFAGVLPAYVLFFGPWLPTKHVNLQRAALVMATLGSAAAVLYSYADPAHFLTVPFGISPVVAGGLPIVAFTVWLAASQARASVHRMAALVRPELPTEQLPLAADFVFKKSSSSSRPQSP